MKSQDYENARDGVDEAVGLLDQRRLLTAKEVAGFLGLPVLTVYYHARAGIIPGRVAIGQRVKFDPEALRRWIANGGTALPEEPK